VVLWPAGRGLGAERLPLTFEQIGLHLEVDLPSTQLVPGHAREPLRSLLDLPAELVLVVESQVALTQVDLLDASDESVLGARFTDTRALGVFEAELEFEAATLADVLREIPPGAYRVVGTAADGARFQGAVEFAPQLPGPFRMLSPAPGAQLGLEDVVLEWTPSRGAAEYTVEIEDEELGMTYVTRLPAVQTLFQVPASILAAGRHYDISLTVSGDTDDELELETGFQTAAGG
jgi:hypothetical protein